MCARNPRPSRANAVRRVRPCFLRPPVPRRDPAYRYVAKLALPPYGARACPASSMTPQRSEGWPNFLLAQRGTGAAGSSGGATRRPAPVRELFLCERQDARNRQGFGKEMTRGEGRIRAREYTARAALAWPVARPSSGPSPATISTTSLRASTGTGRSLPSPPHHQNFRTSESGRATQWAPGAVKPAVSDAKGRRTSDVLLLVVHPTLVAEELPGEADRELSRLSYPRSMAWRSPVAASIMLASLLTC